MKRTPEQRQRERDFRIGFVSATVLWLAIVPGAAHLLAWLAK